MDSRVGHGNCTTDADALLFVFVYGLQHEMVVTGKWSGDSGWRHAEN